MKSDEEHYFFNILNEKSAELQNVELSVKLKKRINRIFRERVGAKNRIPHPEVDNAYERLRSGIVRAFVVAMRCLKR